MRRSNARPPLPYARVLGRVRRWPAVIIKVLGSAAGGGFPQANCNCRNCADVRRGVPGLLPHTQSSLAVSGDGRSWALLNASPDLRQQIAATPELWPQGDAVRSSPIEVVVLSNGDVDHVAGLLSLREGLAFTLYASARVHATLAANSIFNALDTKVVRRDILPLDRPVELPGGVLMEAFAVAGKVALYLEGEADTAEGDTLGFKLTDLGSGASAFYIPACAAVDAALATRLREAALVLFDGTLYTDDEMIAQGLSSKTGRRMGHVSMSGPDGSIAAFAGLDVKRKVFVHINNSNPVLREGSAERRAVDQAGWEVATDGMEIRL
jgi:pyrroloquinoline quinone biosynthesis protein B